MNREGEKKDLELKVEKNDKSSEFNFKIVLVKGFSQVGTYTLNIVST